MAFVLVRVERTFIRGNLKGITIPEVWWEDAALAPLPGDKIDKASTDYIDRVKARYPIPDDENPYHWCEKARRTLLTMGDLNDNTPLSTDKGC